MRPVTVDFVSRRPIARSVGYALAGILVLAAIQQAWVAWLANQRLHVSRAQIEGVRSGMRNREDQSVASPAQPEPSYAKDAAAVSAASQFDAGVVLTALENVQILGIKVVALELSVGDQLARVDLEYTDPGALSKYLEELNTGLPAAQSWTLLRVQAPAGNAAGTAEVRAPGSFWRREPSGSRTRPEAGRHSGLEASRGTVPNLAPPHNR